MRNLDVYGKYFCGNEISTYGQEHNRVDYRTFAKAFNAVLANDLMNNTCDIGYWEPISGGEYYEDTNGDTYNETERDEKIEELEERREELEELEEPTPEELQELEEINEDIEALQEYHYNEIYQWYIVDNYGAELCEAAGETLYYNETLDIYLWGVDHWGTAWDYVLTNIRCNTEAQATA